MFIYDKVQHYFENKNINWNTDMYVCINYYGFIKYWNIRISVNVDYYICWHFLMPSW